MNRAMGEGPNELIGQTDNQRLEERPNQGSGGCHNVFVVRFFLATGAPLLGLG